METLLEMLQKLSDDNVAWVRIRLIRKQSKIFLEILRTQYTFTMRQNPNAIIFEEFPTEESRYLLREYLWKYHNHPKKDSFQIESEIQKHVEIWQCVFEELFQNEVN